MAIVAVARDLFDLRRRLGAITVGHSFAGEPITAEALNAAGAMTVLLKDALKPNLVQTLEGQPALVHCGPFANIAHGNNSLVADLVALKLGDFVVTESGFGSDMGMEKFLNIVCRAGGLSPSAVVLVATVRALEHHGGEPGGGPAAIERGAANLRRHLEIVHSFGLKAVVAVNRFPGDTDEEVELVRRLALEYGAHAAELNEGFERGGPGAAALAEAVVDATRDAPAFEHTYPIDAPIEEKIRAIATRVYGADDIYVLKTARDKIDAFTAAGLDRLPICMAKTHLSLSHDATLANAPEGFTVTVRDIRAYTGAGWLVALCGDMQTMPGLAERPAAFTVDIDEDGQDGRPVLSTIPAMRIGGLPRSHLLALTTAVSAGRAHGRERDPGLRRRLREVAEAEREADPRRLVGAPGDEERLREQAEDGRELPRRRDRRQDREAAGQAVALARRDDAEDPRHDERRLALGGVHALLADGALHEGRVPGVGLRRLPHAGEGERLRVHAPLASTSPSIRTIAATTRSGASRITLCELPAAKTDSRALLSATNAACASRIAVALAGVAAQECSATMSTIGRRRGNRDGSSRAAVAG